MRNHTAKQNLMKMKKGDRAFFYHSGDGKEVVGIAEVIRESYPDPTAAPGEPWVVVDVKALTPFDDAGDARRHQGRADAQGHGARQAVAPFGAAGNGGGMEAHLRHGRRRTVMGRDLQRMRL